MVCDPHDDIYTKFVTNQEILKFYRNCYLYTYVKHLNTFLKLKKCHLKNQNYVFNRGATIIDKHKNIKVMESRTNVFQENNLK